MLPYKQPNINTIVDQIQVIGMQTPMMFYYLLKPVTPPRILDFAKIAFLMSISV